MTILDERVLRTNKKLKDTLNQLIESKSFHSITVSEIAEVAGVNRSTLYLHYNSIYHLLGECLLSG